MAKKIKTFEHLQLHLHGDRKPRTRDLDPKVLQHLKEAIQEEYPVGSLHVIQDTMGNNVVNMIISRHNSDGLQLYANGDVVDVDYLDWWWTTKTDDELFFQIDEHLHMM